MPPLPTVISTVPSLLRKLVPVQALSVMMILIPSAMFVSATMETKSGLSELTPITMMDPGRTPVHDEPVPALRVARTGVGLKEQS